MRYTKIIAVISLAIVVSSCAEQQQSQQVYVSPQEFKDYNCKQIAKDMAYTSSQYQQMVEQNDGSELLTTALAAYMVSQRYSFSTQEDPQAAYLKAKYDALHQASIQKNCD